jgi:hypothetical protein
LFVLSLCVVVIGIDNTVLNVALPTIVRDLGATGSDLQWIVDAYTIVFACLLLTAGSLGDRYGRKYALRFGLIWFGTFSLRITGVITRRMLIVRGSWASVPRSSTPRRFRSSPTPSTCRASVPAIGSGGRRRRRHRARPARRPARRELVGRRS